jgi:hypothetical protein
LAYWLIIKFIGWLPVGRTRRRKWALWYRLFYCNVRITNGKYWLLNPNIFCYSRLSNCDKDFFTFSLCLSNQFCSEKCFLHWIKFTEMTKTDIVHLQNTEQNGPFRNLFFTIVHISELCSPLCYLSNILCKTANFLLILQNRLNEQK